MREEIKNAIDLLSKNGYYVNPEHLCEERDIPKKLKRYRRFMGTMFDLTFCPVCEQTIPDNGKVINYCSFCGQRLSQKEWEFGD